VSFLLFIKVLGALTIAATAIGLSFVAVRQLLIMERKRRERLEQRYKAMIDYSDFSEKQKLWLMNSAVSKMVAYQVIGRNSSYRFYTLNEAAIVILGLNIAIPAIIAAFWPAQAMHGLAFMAFLSAIGVISTGLDKLEQNSSRWQDCHELAGLIEDALDELLTDTPAIPLEKQFDQFVQEYRAICKLEREMQRTRVKNAQDAATAQAEDIKAGIAQGREEYRSSYEQAVVVPSPVESFEQVQFSGRFDDIPGQITDNGADTIDLRAQAYAAADRTRAQLGMTVSETPIDGAAGMTPSEFIARSLGDGGDGGDDAVLFDDDDDSEPLSGVFKAQW
jgi:ABC-type multidrug transport system fused ATPase/permease subunit